MTAARVEIGTHCKSCAFREQGEDNCLLGYMHEHNYCPGPNCPGPGVKLLIGEELVILEVLTKVVSAERTRCNEHPRPIRIARAIAIAIRAHLGVADEPILR